MLKAKEELAVVGVVGNASLDPEGLQLESTIKMIYVWMPGCDVAISAWRTPQDAGGACEGESVGEPKQSMMENQHVPALLLACKCFIKCELSP